MDDEKLNANSERSLVVVALSILALIAFTAILLAEF
jgi:hypothetical protein